MVRRDNRRRIIFRNGFVDYLLSPGLDGALESLQGQSYGPYLLGLAALGLVAYGAYCLLNARYRRIG